MCNTMRKLVLLMESTAVLRTGGACQPTSLWSSIQQALLSQTVLCQQSVCVLISRRSADARLHSQRRGGPHHCNVPQAKQRCVNIQHFAICPASEEDPLAPSAGLGAFVANTWVLVLHFRGNHCYGQADSPGVRKARCPKHRTAAVLVAVAGI